MAKILAIDDDENALEIYKLVLQKDGHELQLVSNYQDALSIISAFDPDVILLDILMGGVDGRYLCKEIRGNNITSKIILISASPLYLKTFKEFGADDFIEKPFDIKFLSDKIASHL